MNAKFDENKIPVTIITGFLGSGKTTLLNNIIKKYSHKKFAIIENEFGEIGIDGELIVGTNDNIFELANGCICCSLTDGFYETIVKLLERGREFNHLLIETTGIADPDSIIQGFIASDDMQQRFKLDSVVCLADANNLEDLLGETPEVYKQLALADIVLLNKTDGVSTSYALQIESDIAKINPFAKIYRVAHSNISDVDILDTYVYSGKVVEQAVSAFRNLSYSGQNNAKPTSLLFNNNNQGLKHDITSEGFSIPGSFDMEKFGFWLQNYLFFNKSTIFRVKGILSFTNEPQRYICQAVKSNLMIEAGESWDNESRFNKLVFIGKKINRQKLEDSLYQLLLK